MVLFGFIRTHSKLLLCLTPPLYNSSRAAFAALFFIHTCPHALTELDVRVNLALSMFLREATRSKIVPMISKAGQAND